MSNHQKPFLPLGATDLTGSNDATGNQSKDSRETFSRSTFRQADCICLDVDSTVCIDEAINELAKFVGVHKEAAELTKSAMSGQVDIRQAMYKQLALVNPSRSMIENFIKNKPSTLTPGVKELVDLLHKNGVAVYLISGGIVSVIEPVAKKLKIPKENIIANRLKFYYDGSYAGFDEDAFTSKQGGKGQAIAWLRKKHNYKKIVMIGDGINDVESCPPADTFIGFGGNVVREKVKEMAHWFVMSFQELIDEYKKR